MSTSSRLLVALGLAWIGLAAPCDAHVNDKLGFRITLPKEFELSRSSFDMDLPTLDDNYLVDVFKSSKEISVANDWFGYHRGVYTLWFPTRNAVDIAKKEQEDREKKEKEGAEKKPEIIIGGVDERIYNSFKEWAEGRVQGFYFGPDKAGKVAGFDAVIREMVFEKGTRFPLRWLSCSYQLPGGEFAVMCTCTEQHFKKFQNEMTGMFASFKLSDPAGLKTREWQDWRKRGVEMQERLDEHDLSPGEILKRRREQKEQAFQKVIAELEKGWEHFETDNYLVVYQGDPKYAKLASRQAEGVRAWLEENFGTVGQGYVQAAILRIYGDTDRVPQGPMFTFHTGKGSYVQEIRFAKPTNKGWDAEFASLNRDVARNWFDQKNEELWQRMPTWLSSGLVEYIDDAEMKGAQLTFGTDQWEKDRMVDAFVAQKKYDKEKSGEPPLKPLNSLMKMTTKQAWDGDNWRYTGAQCSSVIRYLLEGPGKRADKTAKILPTYLSHLYDLVAEIEKRLDEEEAAAKGGEEKDKASMSDEERLKAEDEEYKKKRSEAFDKVEEDLLQKAFDRTFGTWTEADWKALDRSWFQYADGRTK